MYAKPIEILIIIFMAGKWSIGIPKDSAMKGDNALILKVDFCYIEYAALAQF